MKSVPQLLKAIFTNEVNFEGEKAVSLTILPQLKINN